VEVKIWVIPGPKPAAARQPGRIGRRKVVACGQGAGSEARREFVPVRA